MLLSLLHILLRRGRIIDIDVPLLIRIVLVEGLLYDSHMRPSIDDVNLLVYHYLNIYIVIKKLQVADRLIQSESFRSDSLIYPPFAASNKLLCLLPLRYTKFD